MNQLSEKSEKEEVQSAKQNRTRTGDGRSIYGGHRRADIEYPQVCSWDLHLGQWQFRRLVSSAFATLAKVCICPVPVIILAHIVWFDIEP